MTPRARRVAVTGATGFIGRQAVPALLRRGAAVVALGRGARPGHVHLAAEWRTLDLLAAADGNALRAAVAGCDTLLHLAWITEPGAYRQSPLNAPWHQASLALARSFVACGGRRIIAAGTGAEHDTVATGDPAAPLPDRYVSAKVALHRDLVALAASTGLSCAWARIFQPYGPHEDRRRLVPDIARRLLRGEAAVCRHGALRRDFIHVEDAGAALAAIALSEIGGALDVCSGQAAALSDVASRIALLAGRRALLTIQDLPAVGEPAVRCGDPRMLRAAGFVPAHDLTSGLAGTVAFWREALRAEALEA